jgi:hypothetical protein
MTACASVYDVVQPEERFGFIKRAAQRETVAFGIATRQHDAGTIYVNLKIGVVEALGGETCGCAQSTLRISIDYNRHCECRQIGFGYEGA